MEETTPKPTKKRYPRTPKKPGSPQAPKPPIETKQPPKNTSNTSIPFTPNDDGVTWYPSGQQRTNPKLRLFADGALIPEVGFPYEGLDDPNPKTRKQGQTDNTYSAVERKAFMDQITPLLAEGKSLRKATQIVPNCPTAANIVKWISKDPEGLGVQYLEARQTGYALIADEIIEIADDSSGDTVIDESGKLVPVPESTNRARLRIETRKWLLTKMLPKIYGDRVTTEVVGKDGEALTIHLQSPDQLMDYAAKKLSSTTTHVVDVESKEVNDKAIDT